MASKTKEELSQVRKKIEKSIEIAEEERKRKLQSLRLEAARTGIEAFKKRQIGEAVNAFHHYIQILEELKGVEEGKLSPANFDVKKDHQELLMISGIYWDLVKLYDRTKSKAKKKEFLHYMEKYIQFSKGMPFQPLCAESLRKYISSDKPVHRGDFTSAYRVLSVSRCFVATALLDVTHSTTLPRLQEFRDQTLKRSTFGRSMVTWYYRMSPKLAEKVIGYPYLLRKTLGLGLDCLAYLLQFQSKRTIRSVRISV